VPAGGYTVPSYSANDPLVSPDYGGWWSRGLAIAARGWPQLATLQAIGVVLSVAAQVPSLLLVRSTQLQMTAALDEGNQPDVWPVLLRFLGVAVLAGLLAFIVSALVTLATVYIGVSVAVGGRPSLSAAFALAGRRLLPLIGWQLLSLPIFLLGFCVCVLPVLYVAAVFTVLPAVVAIERSNAVGRCFTLFNRNLGVSIARIATILVIIIVVAVVGVGLQTAVRSVLATAGPETALSVLLTTLVSTLVTAAAGIVIAPLTLAAYADMRSRIEPINAAVIAGELGVQPMA
jgi:hypothetical protein